MKNVINEEFTPRRATQKSAGYDIFVNENITLCPGEYKTLDTGVVFEDNDIMFSMTNTANHIISKKNPKGVFGKFSKKINLQNEYVGLIFPRSSYGFKYGLRFANSICVIDQDYRDTIRLNITVDNTLNLVKGDRIAQIVFVPWLIYGGEIVPEDLRGGGIGSTGN